MAPNGIHSRVRRGGKEVCRRANDLSVIQSPVYSPIRSPRRQTTKALSTTFGLVSLLHSCQDRNQKESACITGLAGIESQGFT